MIDSLKNHFRPRLEDPEAEKAEKGRLEQLRTQALQDHDMTEADVSDYSKLEKQSQYTPEWICPCGVDNKCAQSTCSGCHHERPKLLHGLLDLDGFEGLARRVEQKKLTRLNQVRDEINREISEWNTQNGPEYEILKYRFFDSHNHELGKLNWEQYMGYLLSGGRV